MLRAETPLPVMIVLIFETKLSSVAGFAVDVTDWPLMYNVWPVSNEPTPETVAVTTGNAVCHSGEPTCTHVLLNADLYHKRIAFVVAPAFSQNNISPKEVIAVFPYQHNNEAYKALSSMKDWKKSDWKAFFSREAWLFAQTLAKVWAAVSKSCRRTWREEGLFLSSCE